MELLLQVSVLYETSLLADLHSNMELLLRRYKNEATNRMCIYIPIWSYFYKSSNEERIKENLIYIPIWSYFYLNISAIISLTLPFTFQYGATSTVESLIPFSYLFNLHSNMELLLQVALMHLLIYLVYLHSNMELLLLFPLGYSNLFLLHLHSNMELLLLTFSKTPSIIFLIYIPIWSYFYTFLFNAQFFYCL